VNSKIPVFFGYGSFDNVVTPNLSEKAFEFLKANGNPIEKHSYPMMHSVCVEELEELGKWITFLYSFK
jgi:phospholipase/carboxylesterase